MESVKRLWKYANGPCVYKNQKRVLLEIAEAFEVEHAEAYAQAYDDGYDVGFASADDWLADHEEAMAEHGWVKLPKDADGETWHLGDMVCADGVTASTVFGVGENELFIRDSEYDLGWCVADKNRHYHEPTVEDVLREFSDAILEWAGKSGSVAEVGTWSDVAAEYAAKLRLAGDE